MAEPRGKKSSRLGKLMSRFSDKESPANASSSSASNNTKREPPKKRASLKRLTKRSSSKAAAVTPGWSGLRDSPRGNQEGFGGHEQKSKAPSDKEIVATANGDRKDESKSTPLATGSPIATSKNPSSTPEKSTPKTPGPPEKPPSTHTLSPKGNDERAFHEESPSTSVASTPRSSTNGGASAAASASASAAPAQNASASPATGKSTPVVAKDEDGFATPTMTVRSSASNTPRSSSRSTNRAPPCSTQLQESLVLANADSSPSTPTTLSMRKSSFELNKHQELSAERRKPKNAEMEELDTLRRGTNISKLARSMTETWGKRVEAAQAEAKASGGKSSSTLGAPKTKMRRTPSLVVRAMSQRYLETAASETEFKRRKSEFALRRKAGIRTLDEESKQKATVIIEKNMTHKAKMGAEGMLSDYMQACDPTHLQDLVERGLIETQALNANGEIDVSMIESNEFNLNNNEFMGRLGREQFEDKVHEIVDFIAENKQIKILSLTNAGVDTYFGIQIARMMMENSHITELNLESNDIYEQGIELMAEVLKKNKSLKILKLTNQKRYPSHVAKNALIKALENNHEIIRFSYDFMNIRQNDLKDKYLNRNQKWSRHKNKMAPSRSPSVSVVSSRRRRTVMERVSTAKQNSELDLALQRYSEAGANHTKFDLSQMSPSFRRLTDLQMAETISKIEEILNGNPFFERVVFKNSSVKDDLARVIAKCVAKNNKIRELNLEANDLSSDFLIELTDILSENTGLQVLNLRHQRKEPSRAVATAFVSFLEKNHSILKMGFKFTQTRQDHLKERYLKRNAKQWREERAIRKAEEAEKQSMLDAQEGDENERVHGDATAAKDGELQPTRGGLADQTTNDANLSPTTSPLISPLTSPVARDRSGRPLSWGGTMELELDKLMPATPKNASRAATPSSPSTASVASSLSGMSPAPTPRSRDLNTEEKTAEKSDLTSSTADEQVTEKKLPSVTKSKPVPLSAQPSFTQISLNLSALTTSDDEGEDNGNNDDVSPVGDDDDTATTGRSEEAAEAEVEGGPAMMDSDDDE